MVKSKEERKVIVGEWAERPTWTAPQRSILVSIKVSQRLNQKELLGLKTYKPAVLNNWPVDCILLKKKIFFRCYPPFLSYLFMQDSLFLYEEDY